MAFYKSKELGIETPEPGNPPAITANLKNLAEQIDTLLRKQVTKQVELAKLKVTESLELPAGAITGTEIQSGFGGNSVKSIIATEQERENTGFGKLATPDEVTVVLPTNGLILIGYQAAWKSGTAGKKASAAVFIGANQLVIAAGASSPVEQEASHTQATFQSLATTTIGLATHESGTYGTDATTGQVISPGAAIGGGLVAVFAAAGTYAISVQFKTEANKVLVKNRKLWATVIN